MTEQPNPADFSADEKPREFRATIEVRGTMWLTIEADSLDEARRKADALAIAMEDEPMDVELDEVGDVRVRRVAKSPTMYRVIRDGQKMQVSRLTQGDLPRQPDASGF